MTLEPNLGLKRECQASDPGKMQAQSGGGGAGDRAGQLREDIAARQRGAERASKHSMAKAVPTTHPSRDAAVHSFLWLRHQLAGVRRQALRLAHAMVRTSAQQMHNGLHRLKRL
jgi:hypothetical protein